MKEVWLYSVVCLCMLQSCTRIESDESGEQEICFRGNVQELQQVNLSESRVGLGSGNKVQLYIVEQDEEGVKLPASEDFYQMSIFKCNTCLLLYIYFGSILADAHAAHHTASFCNLSIYE